MGLYIWLIWKMSVTTLIMLKVPVIRFEEFEEITGIFRGFQHIKL